MWLLALSCLFAGTQAAEQADATQAAAAPVPMEIFKGPKALELRPPDYPASERREGHEGWVEVNFMVDPQGKPYEIAVIESTGNKAFEKSAVSAVRKWNFEPAMLGDKPIDAGHNFKLIFTIREPATGASQRFVRAYKGLMKAIAAGDRTRAAEEIVKLDVQNLYEDAYRNVAYYEYFRKWGTEAQQLVALRRAIAHERAPRYLKKEQFIAALNSQLLLQVKMQDFAGALDSWEKLQEHAPKDSLGSWEETIAQIEALRKDDRSYGVPGEIGKGGSWFYQLFKTRFQVEIASGHLSEIKLRCEKQYIFFRFEPDVQYKIADKYGSCALELVGDPDTKFELVQS
jgi:TonB family protein